MRELFRKSKGSSKTKGFHCKYKYFMMINELSIVICKYFRPISAFCPLLFVFVLLITTVIFTYIYISDGNIPVPCDVCYTVSQTVGIKVNFSLYFVIEDKQQNNQKC